jgi:hypothetical protein
MIDKPLLVNIFISATVIVVGTLCVFYAEVSRESNEKNDSSMYLDERWKSYTTRYHNDIHMFCLL